MDSRKFRALSAHHRAIVAIAVLLDGREAAAYLENDVVNGSALSAAATDISSLAPEIRMPFVGTLLRETLRELQAEKSDVK